VLSEADKQGGVAAHDAVAGDEAEYAEFVKLYDRVGRQCVRSRRPIEHIEASGVAVYACSGCQT
jgi:formamidopyrimidine-DNA glycosylase